LRKFASIILRGVKEAKEVEVNKKRLTFHIVISWVSAGMLRKNWTSHTNVQNCSTEIEGFFLLLPGDPMEREVN